MGRWHPEAGSLSASLVRNDNKRRSFGTEGVIPSECEGSRPGSSSESKAGPSSLRSLGTTRKRRSLGMIGGVIPRPVLWPRDLGLEAVKKQRQVPRRFARSGRQHEIKPEVPRRFARSGRQEKCGRSRRQARANPSFFTSCDAIGRKAAVRMTNKGNSAAVRS
jgi:hypothetical protein